MPQLFKVAVGRKSFVIFVSEDKPPDVITAASDPSDNADLTSGLIADVTCKIYRLHSVKGFVKNCG